MQYRCKTSRHGRQLPVPLLLERKSVTGCDGFLFCWWDFKWRNARGILGIRVAQLSTGIPPHRSLRLIMASYSAVCRSVMAVLISGLIVTGCDRAGGSPNVDTGPQLPSSGPIVRDTARERAILEVTKAPTGSNVTVFAGPPIAMYPTVVASSPDGSVYVAVDLNLAQGAGAGRGRIMRLKDTDNDGHADEYSIFVEVASPRGIIADGKTVYIMHPPNLTAYRDTTGDGIADVNEVLVKGLGFGLEVRSSDHSTNNITMGIDGWIYVAVGDYGYANAVGKDGATIKRKGGSIVRVRPDGTGLEIYNTGGRNTYDVGIDPFMHVFARDNTNDGGGWNTRFHYLPPLAEMGYPSLFLNFADETMQTLFDFGAGAGTGGLWIQDPGFPEALNNQLYTADWTTNKVTLNPVTPRGASYSVSQEDFLEISHPVDFTMDDRSHMYVASLIGGVFNYAGDTVGAILQVGYPGRPASAALNPTSRTDAELLTALVSANSVHRLWAQRELLQRKTTPATIAALRTLILNSALTPEARAAALFTLPLVAGADAQATLKEAVRDPVLREVALRAMADDRRQLASVDVATYVTALNDTKPGVRVQAINGLVRLDAKSQADKLVPLLASPDSTLSHLAMQALAKLGAREVALKAIKSPDAVVRTRARFVLQQMHDVETVNAVTAAYNGATLPAIRSELLKTLARLYNTDAPWNGEWWGTHPNTTGPYFTPAVWEASPAIKPILRDALSSASANNIASLSVMYARNRVIPVGAAPLLIAAFGSAEQSTTLDALIGTSQLSADAVPLVTRLDAVSPALHSAVAELLAGEVAPTAALLPLVKRSALDRTVSDSVRGLLITALVMKPGDPDEPAALLAQVNPVPTANAADADATGTDATPSAVETAWRRYVGARERNGQLDYFITLSKSENADSRTLAFAILLQSVRSPRAEAATRRTVEPVIAAGFANAAVAPSLARAVRIMRLEKQYADQLKALPNP